MVKSKRGMLDPIYVGRSYGIPSWVTVVSCYYLVVPRSPSCLAICHLCSDSGYGPRYKQQSYTRVICRSPIRPRYILLAYSPIQRLPLGSRGCAALPRGE